MDGKDKDDDRTKANVSVNVHTTDENINDKPNRNRKRKHPGHEFESPRKNTSGNNTDRTATTESLSLKDNRITTWENDNMSMEALLSVPLSFLLRETSTSTIRQRRRKQQQLKQQQKQQQRPLLLSRGEAQTFLQISQLSHEMDLLVQLSTTAIERNMICRSLSSHLFRHSASTSSSSSFCSYYSRSLYPLLSLHGTQTVHQVLAYVQSTMERIMDELASCAVTLRQFAEQNWSVAEYLCHSFEDEESEDRVADTCEGSENRDQGGGSSVAVGKLGTLGWDKRMVAEVEEMVCFRIDALISMSLVDMDTTDDFQNNDFKDAFELAVDVETGKFVSMAEFCTTIMGHSIMEGNADDSSAEELQPGKKKGFDKENTSNDPSIGDSALSLQTSNNSNEQLHKENSPSMKQNKHLDKNWDEIQDHVQNTNDEKIEKNGHSSLACDLYSSEKESKNVDHLTNIYLEDGECEESDNGQTSIEKEELTRQKSDFIPKEHRNHTSEDDSNCSDMDVQTFQYESANTQDKIDNAATVLTKIARGYAVPNDRHNK